jgi:hypothetical protein
MAKRLQVLIDDSEYREIRRIARSRHLSIAEWVRSVLALARREEPLVNTSKKLDAVRVAVHHSFPTGDIQQMLAEVESGYPADRNA